MSPVRNGTNPVHPDLALAPNASAEFGSLRDRVALILGAGCPTEGWSNGAAIGLTYARAGALVVCGDLVLEFADRTASAIDVDGGCSEAAQVDVTVEESIRAVVDGVLQAHGRIDILHNNVGVTAVGDVVSRPPDVWRRTFEVNTTSVFNSLRCVLPHMRVQKAGAVINTSSVAAVMYTNFPHSAYSASKAAVNHLTRTVAVDEAPHGIRVNAVMPGLIDSPLIYSQLGGAYSTIDEMVAARSAAAPMGRMGTVWDVARASRFLASDEASYVTGVCLAVDGGLTATTFT